jgi:hypothetical protein
MRPTGVFTSGVVTAFIGFWRRDLSPRLAEIVLTQDFALATSAGCLLAVWGPSVLTGAPRLTDFAMGFLAYAAIALGFCVAGMTIAMTLPDRSFVEKLAKLEIQGRAGNALSSLYFVFTWTALVHWSAIVCLLLALAMNGGASQSFVSERTPGRRLIVGVVGFVCIYALLQFLITMLTLAHVGSHFVSGLRRSGSDSARPDA